MDILGIIKNFIAAVAAGLGWGKQRDAEKNAPAQQSNAQAEQIEELREKADQAIASPDQTDINRMTDQ